MPPVDIFKIEDQVPHWLETAVSLDAAKKRVELLMASSPAEYLIIDFNRDERLIIKPK